MQYPDIGNTLSKLLLITAHAQRDKDFIFTSLAHLLDVEYLRDCYYHLKRNKAVGIDGISWRQYGENLDENLDTLVSRLKRKKFKPKPARRVYIPKNDRQTRPLGIPAIESKIVEKGIARILNCIYEQDFLDSSYGFRPERNCHQALKRVDELIRFQPVNHIVEADIKGFFDNVDHDRLIEFIRKRVNDTALIGLLVKFLRAGYIDGGQLELPESGTPQGGILSPILANIFLHYVLDEWFETTVKSHTRGYCELVRYADDFVCVVRYSNDARRIEKALQKRFNKYGLELHPEKSRNISFGKFERENANQQDRKPNNFDFLGITHYCDLTRKGNFKIGRKTGGKKFRTKCKDMNDWLKAKRNLLPTKEWWKILAAKLRGHYQYYGISENYASIRKFYRNTLYLVRKWLNRRSQKSKMSWDKFYEYIEHYPLPKPKIAHSFYGWKV
jgi:RNA-directed DNA polymerase